MGYKKRTPIDESVLVNNPLAQTDFRINVRKMIKKSHFRRDKDGNMYQVDYELEQDRSTKVYVNSDHRKSVALLSAPSKSLLLWIVFELKPGKDFIWINKQMYMDDHKMKDMRSIDRAVFELTRYLFIQPTVFTDWYWINPKLIFSGSRPDKYPDNVFISSESSVEEPAENYGGKKVEDKLVVTNDEQAEYIPKWDDDEIEDLTSNSQTVILDYEAYRTEVVTPPASNDDWFEQMANLTKGL